MRTVQVVPAPTFGGAKLSRLWRVPFVGGHDDNHRSNHLSRALSFSRLWRVQESEREVRLRQLRHLSLRGEREIRPQEKIWRPPRRGTRPEVPRSRHQTSRKEVRLTKYPPFSAPRLWRVQGVIRPQTWKPSHEKAPPPLFPETRNTSLPDVET